MRYLLNKKKLRTRIIGTCLVLVLISAGCSISHKEKARQYLSRALDELKRSVEDNPSDKKLQEEFYTLAKIYFGETQAKVEVFLLYQTINQENQASKILQEIATSNSQEVTKYLKEKLESEYEVDQRIAIYRALTYLNPQDADLFDKLGRLYLGTGQKQKGIECIQKSIDLGNRNQETIKYLVRAYVNEKNYDQAIEFLKNLIAEKDDIQLHQQLAEIYKKQGKKDLYLAEIENISKKGGKKSIFLALKPERFEKTTTSPPPKKLRLETIVLNEKISVDPYRFILVDKSSQELSVYEFDGQTVKEVLKVVCTTGKNCNDKQKAGDFATPEGTFLIKTFIPSSKLDPKYGAGAYVLDFPDYLSTRLNKSGSGIWLHGTPIERPPYNSEGCVVVNDRDFLLLQPYIEVGKTFIHILKSKQDMNLADIVQAWHIIKDWEQSWESLDINSYLSYYDENFKNDGKDKRAWASYKKRVNSRKKYVKVELKDTQIIPYGKTDFGYVFLVDTIQDYDSNDLKSTTRKNIYLVKNNGVFKIIGEQVR